MRLLRTALERIGTPNADEIRATVAQVLEAYDERVVEFPRGDVLVFADEAMRTTSLSRDQMTLTIDETKRAYNEAYR